MLRGSGTVGQAALPGVVGGVLHGLPHPRRLVDQNAEDRVDSRSPGWCQAMLRIYRRLFRCHTQYLSVEQRALGDRFVRTEFRRHVAVTPREAALFYKGWCDYLRQLEAGAAQMQRQHSSLGGAPRHAPGRDLTPHEHNSLTEEQKERLQSLRRHALELKAHHGFRQ